MSEQKFTHQVKKDAEFIINWLRRTPSAPQKLPKYLMERVYRIEEEWENSSN